MIRNTATLRRTAHAPIVRDPASPRSAARRLAAGFACTIRHGPRPRAGGRHAAVPFPHLAVRHAGRRGRAPPRPTRSRCTTCWRWTGSPIRGSRPTARLVAFTVSVTDLATNKRRTDLYLAAADGSCGAAADRRTRPATSQPRWAADGKAIYFLSTRSGSSQVWRIALDGGEAEQVTRLPLDVDALEVAPGGDAPASSRWRSSPARARRRPRQALDAKEKDEGDAGWSSTASSSATGTPGRTARATTCSPITLPRGPGDAT